MTKQQTISSTFQIKPIPLALFSLLIAAVAYGAYIYFGPKLTFPPDTKIVKSTGNYAYKNTTNVFQTQFKTKPTEEASIVFANNVGKISFFTPSSQSFGTINSVSSPITSGETITYPEVFNKLDLRYTITSSRLLEEFIVKDKDTGSQIKRIEQFASSTSTYTIKEDGSIEFYSGDKLAFTLPHPIIYELDNKEQFTNGIVYEISGDNDKLIISKVITAEGSAWMADENRKYPVAIDLVIDNSDTSTDWVSSDATNTVVSQEATIKQEGSGSVKIASTADSGSTTVDLFEYATDHQARAAAITTGIAATGGTITTGGGYTYHTFTAAGTFAPSVTGQVEVYAWGGGGGGGRVGGWGFGAPGGAGGSAYGKVSITAGASYPIVIGGGGVPGSLTGAAGGGGAASCNSTDNAYGAGGGGYSGMFLTSIAQANSILIAGGGGGGGSSRAGAGNQGGAGGGAHGERGYSPYNYNKLAYGGNYGVQSGTPGNASSDSANCPAAQGPLVGSTPRVNSYGGGGGGGYVGGTGGGYSESNTMGGGGGGSGFFNPGYVVYPFLQRGTGTTAGDSTNALRGGYGNAGAASGNGTQGIVYIRYPTGGYTTSGYPSDTTGMKASGGTMTTSGGYVVHTFTADDQLFSPYITGTALVNMWGGGGAGGTVGGWTYASAGGGGGSTSGTLNFSDSQHFHIMVGGGGGVNAVTTAGAVGGGGAATNNNSDNRYAGGGGGMSGLFLSYPAIGQAIMIAGGGGGGGSSRAGSGNGGGAGGGAAGQNGYSSYDGKAAYGGNGGQWNAAGANASSDSANGGGGQGQFQGGVTRTNSYGGGGGGGLWGGSAGGYSESNTMGGGGGGSGFYAGGWITGGALYTGSGITTGDSANALRSNAGDGGTPAVGGNSGRVVIRYPVPPLEAYAEGTIKSQGTYALKGVAQATTSLNATLSRIIATPLNLTNRTSVSFDLRSTRTGSNIKVGLRDTGGVITELTPSITVADTYQTKTFDLSAVSNANKDAINKIIITIVNADAINTFYIDNMVAGTFSVGDTITRTTGASNLSGEFNLTFWVRSTVAGTYSRFQFGEAASTEQTYNITINQANTWEQKVWDITGITGTARDAVTKFAFTFTGDTSGAQFYFDDIQTNAIAAPTLGTPTALSTSSIRWNFTDTSTGETGFKIYDASSILQVTCASPNIGYCDETNLATNSQYTRKIGAYSSAATAISGGTVSRYTLAAIPNPPVVNSRTTSTVLVNPDLATNPAGTLMAIYMEVGNSCDGSGGVYIAADGSSNGATAVWQNDATWGAKTVTGLTEPVYTFCVKAKNGDDVETSFSTSGADNEGFVPMSGDFTVTTNTSGMNRYIDGYNPARYVIGIDSGTGVTNNARFDLQSGIFTLNSNETLVTGTMTLTGGSIAIANGAIIRLNTPAWAVDADGDGYSTDNKLYYGPVAPTNGRRKAALSTLATADCSDTDGARQLPLSTRFVSIISGSPYIAYSNDGLAWSPAANAVFATSYQDSEMWGTAWNGTRWVAGGEGANTLAYSPDGVTWTGLGTSIFSGGGHGIAWNGTRFVATGQGTNSLAYSSDGITWTGLGTSIFSTSANDVTWNGTRFVAVGSGTNSIAYSSDGITWTGIGSSIMVAGKSVTTNGSRFVATGAQCCAGDLAYSNDGISWVSLGNSIFTGNQTGASTWNGSRFVATGQNTNTVAYSSDGITWTGLGYTILDMRGYASGSNGVRTLVGGASLSNVIGYSSDGMNFTKLTEPYQFMGKIGAAPNPNVFPPVGPMCQ